MQKIFSRGNSLLLMLAILLTGIVACKRTFSEPPVLGAPDIVANTTIKDLKARYSSGAPVAINDDVVLAAIVSCDDRSGNYYQQIAVQDSTGGILLRMAGSNLFNNYPVGRQVFVKCKGLYLGQYNGTLQLGGGIDSAYITQGGITLIAANLQDKHVIKGALNQPLEPLIVNVSQLTTNIQDRYVSTLIKLQGFEFATTELGKNYADDATSGNRIIQGCSSPTTNRITLRSSNYANFATLPVPLGNGDIIGVYSFFGSTKQFTIRDTTDLRFYGARCPNASGGGTLNLGSSSPFTLTFDNIGTSGLPAGVFVKEGASAADLGFDGTIYQTNFNSNTAWNQTSGGFKNFASATGLFGNTNSGNQALATNRALGLRQTSSIGDPGGAFAFLLPNTTGKSNMKLEFKLQSLDSSATLGRTTSWRVDYAFGQAPTAFSPIATVPTPLSTQNGVFANTAVTVNFGTLLNNLNQPVWIRIVTISNTTGGGNRASSAIDDVKFTWN